MFTSDQLMKVQAYITNPAEQLNATELRTAFQVNPTEFAFQLNKFLRANLATPAMESYLQELDELYKSNILTDDLTVHRACNYLEMFPTMMNGNYMDLGYISTSMDKNVITRFFNGSGYYVPAYVQISLPKGTPVLLLDNIPGLANDTYEKEVLIGRRAAFRIEGQRRLIKGEAVPAEFRDAVERCGEMFLIKLIFVTYLTA